MQKKLSQFVRLLFALVVAFGAFAPIGVNAQPPIEPGIGPVIAEAKIDDHVPTIAEAKQREPRLMSEAEQAKAYGAVDRDFAEKWQKSDDGKAGLLAWRENHDEMLRLQEKAQPSLPQSQAPDRVPEALPTQAPPQSHAPKTLQKPAVFQGSPRQLNVIILHYITVVTVSIPAGGNAVNYFPTVVQYHKQAVQDGSKFQGTGAQALAVNVVQTYTVNGAAPTLNFPQAGVYDTGKYTKFMDMATIYNTYNLCNQFKAGTLDAVWIWSDGFSAPNQGEFYVNGTDWETYSVYSNLPKCGRAGVPFSFVYVNNTSSNGSGQWFLPFLEQSVHSYAHYIEKAHVESNQWDYSVCDFVDGDGRPPSGITGDTRYATAYCPGRPLSHLYGFTAHPNAGNSNVGMCGDVHLPPNITTLIITNTYDYDNPATVQSRCNTWQWGVNTTPQSISCSTWQCEEYWFLTWWLQRIPSLTTNATGRTGAQRPNHWDKIPTLIPKSDVIVRNDFDGDKKTDYVVYRPSDGYFYVRPAGGGSAVTSSAPCVISNRIPRTGRRTASPTSMYLVYQTTTGNYYESLAGSCTNFSTITSGLQVGSAKFSYTNQALNSDAWRYNATTGAWTISYAAGASGPFPTSFTLGGTGYATVIADYDGDGILDPAVYKASNGEWRIYQSSNLSTTVTLYGGGSYVPVPADYDGDKKADLAVWDSGSGNWVIKYTVSGQTLTRAWGGGSDVPVPADYDGDGYANIAVWRPSNGTWYAINRDNSSTSIAWGASGDIPLSPNPW